MKHCSFCNAELPEGTTVCPSCGKDNAQGKAGTLKPGATVLMVVAAVAVVILAVGVLFGVRNGWTTNAVSDMEIAEDTVTAEESSAEETAAETTEPEPTQAPTVPADGNPDDVTCKGT